MENENITLNEASIFYKRIDKDTYLIGKDKDSYGQFLIEDAIAPLLFSSINEINRKKMTTDSLSPDRRFIFNFYLMTLYFPKSIASIWSSQIHSYFEYESKTIEQECLNLDSKKTEFATEAFLRMIFSIMNLTDALDFLYPGCFTFEEKKSLENTYQTDQKSFPKWFLFEYSDKINNWISEMFKAKFFYDDYIRKKILKRGLPVVHKNEQYELNWIFIQFVAIDRVVREFSTEYEEWKSNIYTTGIFNLENVILTYTYALDKLNCFRTYYTFFEKRILSPFFRMMHNNTLKNEEKEWIIRKLRNLGIDGFMQDEYNMYKHKNDEHIIHFCDIVDSPLTNNDIYRLPMPDGFDNKKLVKLHQAFYSYVDAGQPLCYFLGSSTSNTDTKTVLWNGDRHTLQVFIRELYGKDAKGKLKTVPDGIWKITSNIFMPKGKKLSENTLKTGKIGTKQLPEETRLEIAENIQKIRILKWKDTN